LPFRSRTQWPQVPLRHGAYRGPSTLGAIVHSYYYEGLPLSLSLHAGAGRLRLTR
jgi:hypothetical protein